MDHKPKVMLFDGSLAIGGTERSILDLATLINKSRFEVLIYCFSHKDHFALKAQQAGIRVSSAGFDFRFLSFLRCCRKVLQTLRSEQIDILHCSNHPTLYYGVVLGVLAQVPYIVTAVRNDGSWKTASHRFWDRIVDRYADTVIANSHSARDHYVRRKPPDVCSKVITIYGGIQPSAANEHHGGVPPRPSTQLAIGIIGRVNDLLKGHSDFIKAARIVSRQRKGITFYVIGDGPDRAKLETLAAECGLTHELHFTGRMVDLAQIYSLLDIVVIPSRSESLPNVLLEAMYFEKAVVATAVGDIPLVLDDQRTGLLIPMGDPEALARNLLLLIDQPELIRRFGREARRRLDELGLRADVAVRKTEEAFLALTAASPKPRPISMKLLIGMAGFLLLQLFLAARRRLLPNRVTASTF